MFYLNKAQFEPAMILFGLLFIPCIIALIVANFMFSGLVVFLTLILVLAIYIVIVIFNLKESQKTDYYLLLNNQEMEIVYHDLILSKTKINLSFDQINRIEYYRMNSLKGWSMLYSYLYPKCVFMTYTLNGEEKTVFIGYLNYEDIKMITNQNNIDLVVY